MATEDLLKENERLKSALKDLTRDKNTLEYLVYKSFTKILNAKKQRIKELEEKIEILKTQNQGTNTKKNENDKKVRTRTKSAETSSEEENSDKLYDIDTDVDDSDGDNNSGPLSSKDAYIIKKSPVKEFVDTADMKKKDDGSDTDLSQSQSQENYSQYLLKPYSNSLPSEADDCDQRSPSGEKGNQENNNDDYTDDHSKPKRKKLLEDTTDSDLLEELLDDL